MPTVQCIIGNYEGDHLGTYAREWDEATGLLDWPIGLEPGQNILVQRDGETVKIAEMFGEPAEDRILGFKERK